MSLLKRFRKFLLDQPAAALVLLALPFVFIYGSFYLGSGQIYNSPDETANAVFLQRYAQEQTFFYPIESDLPEQVMPRSVQRRGAYLVPTGFLGLPLFYGLLVAVLGVWIMPFLTPLFAAGASVAFFFILRRVFDEKTAFLSAVFLLFLPQWWHFAAKGFLPNVPFFACFLIGLSLLIAAHDALVRTKQAGLGLMGGVFVAAALLIRPAEMWWFIFVFMVLGVVYRNRIRLAALIGMAAGGGLMLLVWMPVQVQTYGSLFASGYGTGQAITGESAAAFSSVFFPFGIDLFRVFASMFSFIVQLFWWQILLACAGMIFLWKGGQSLSHHQRVYVGISIAVAVYLFLLYGSWPIQDDLDPDRVSIGISYVRYWLPVFVALIPFMVIGIDRLANMIMPKAKKAGAVFFVAVLLAHTVFVHAAGDDHLSALRKNIVHYQQLRELASTLPESSIILSERMDKVFWPERKVIEIRGDRFTILDDLAPTQERLFWFTILPADHVGVLEQREFLPRGYRLNKAFSHEAGTMYQLIPRL